MGNACKCVCRQTDEDEATDALLDGFESLLPHSRPRGPPPPYQVEAPLYSMSEEQRVQLVQRVTMIQSLPLGRYDVGEDKKKAGMLEPSEEVQGSEKKGEMDRECPICMVDFAVGEPIRLLPCMHFYHMRCIDEWLMRSFCCPSCMERVDVGMSNTLTSTSSPSPTHSGLRRRRRRRERGSTSSLASLASLGAAPPPRGVEGRGVKRREGAQQYMPVSQHLSGQVASPMGPPPSGQAMYLSQGAHPSAGMQMPRPIGQRTAMSSGQVPVVRGGGGHYLTDFSISGQSSGHTSIGQVEGASGGHDHNVRLLNEPELQRLSQDDLAYSMDQITFCDFQSASGGGRDHPPSPEYSGARAASNVGMATSPRFSPPVFEYHFEYPTSQLPTTPQQ